MLMMRGFDKLSARSPGLVSSRRTMHSDAMANPKEAPVMQPFPDKEGGGWHVIIRYHEGHERRIDGFATEDEAMKWIVENEPELDQ